jgi:flavorubredoxin
MTDAAAQARRQCRALFDEGGHRFIWLGAGEPARERGIPSNQYLVVDGGEAMLLDPGGFHVFERVFDNTLAQVHPEHISRLFLSHQDPDITASLVSWLEVKPGVEVVLSRLWSRFIEHLALPATPNLHGLPDEGEMITLPSGASLTFVPAHFLHAPGNFHVYDSASRTLFTGDLGASLVPDDDPDLVVTDFAAHTGLMEGFHRRYLPCNRAVELYLKRVRDLPVDRVCPQHGKVMAGDDVGRFFDWLAKLDVGFDYRDWGD